MRKIIAFIFLLYIIAGCSNNHSQEKKDSQFEMDVNAIVEEVVRQAIPEVLKDSSQTQPADLSKTIIPLSIHLRRINPLDDRAHDTPPPPPGGTLLTEILNYEVEGNLFFMSKDSLHFIQQHNSIKSFDIDKKITEEIYNTDLSIENLKRGEENKSSWYDISIPLISADGDKAYTELTRWCFPLCSHCEAILLRKENGKWKVVERRRIWIS